MNNGQERREEKGDGLWVSATQVTGEERGRLNSIICLNVIASHHIKSHRGDRETDLLTHGSLQKTDTRKQTGTVTPEHILSHFYADCQ